LRKAFKKTIFPYSIVGSVDEKKNYRFSLRGHPFVGNSSVNMVEKAIKTIKTLMIFGEDQTNMLSTVCPITESALSNWPTK